jgi:frataxin
VCSQIVGTTGAEGLFSGPKRYDYLEADDKWYYSRDGLTMTELLNVELSKALDKVVEINLT